MPTDSSTADGEGATDDPDRGWAVVAALVLALVGAGGAAPPDPFTQLLFLPVLAVLSLPACVYAAAATPPAAGVRPFLAFVAGAVVAGLVGAWAVDLLPFGGLLPALGFLVGVYAAAAAVRWWVDNRELAAV